MIVIPSIDLRGGLVVRLLHGDPAASTIYDDDPVSVAVRYEEAGAQLIHIVDLDAALGDGDNRALLRSICDEVDIDVQAGGGLRDLDAIEAVLAAGAARAVLGTAAANDPPFVSEAVAIHGSAIVVALDVKGRRVMVKGWKEDAGALDELLPALEATGADRFMFTQIAVDGTLEGPDLDLYREAMALTERPVIASGGVHSLDDLRALTEAGVEGAIVGKALYEGTIDLKEALAL